MTHYLSDELRETVEALPQEFAVIIHRVTSEYTEALAGWHGLSEWSQGAYLDGFLKLGMLEDAVSLTVKTARSCLGGDTDTPNLSWMETDTEAVPWKSPYWSLRSFHGRLLDVFAEVALEWSTLADEDRLVVRSSFSALATLLPSLRRVLALASDLSN